MRLMLCGLSAGLDLASMRSMRMTDVANIVSESTLMRGESSEDSVREATQSDIDWLKSL